VHAGSAVLIAGSPSARSKSRALLERAGATLEGADHVVTGVDLASLPAEALLGPRGLGPAPDGLSLASDAR
jgi:NAD(P)H-dependent FMN reductase